MKVLQVFFVVVSCATLVSLTSCSDAQRNRQDEPVEQLATPAPIEAPEPNEAPAPIEAPEPNDAVQSAPADASDTTQGESQVSETEQSTVEEPTASQNPIATQEPDPPRTKVEDRSSSDASRAKGEINFDDLKFEIAKDAPFSEDLLTEDLRSLDGQNVKLRGYILPSTLFSETNISQFVLVRDNQQCCFGPGAALFDCVMVEMAEGKTTDFVTRPVTVEGKFVIDTEAYRYPPGYSPKGATHLAVFRIEGQAVE